jgi:hypothetical protein
MKPEGSLPRLQVSAIYHYPEPDRSSPCPPIPLPKDPSLYCAPIYVWVFQVVSFPRVSPFGRNRCIQIRAKNMFPVSFPRGLQYYELSLNMIPYTIVDTAQTLSAAEFREPLYKLFVTVTCIPSCRSTF